MPNAPPASSRHMEAVLEGQPMCSTWHWMPDAKGEVAEERGRKSEEGRFELSGEALSEEQAEAARKTQGAEEPT